MQNIFFSNDVSHMVLFGKLFYFLKLCLDCLKAEKKLTSHLSVFLFQLALKEAIYE